MERTAAYWQLRNRIERMVDERKDIVINEDGYQVFRPARGRGYHEARELRIVADILDDRNKAWNDEVSQGVRREPFLDLISDLRKLQRAWLQKEWGK